MIFCCSLCHRCCHCLSSLLFWMIQKFCYHGNMTSHFSSLLQCQNEWSLEFMNSLYSYPGIWSINTLRWIICLDGKTGLCSIWADNSSDVIHLFLHVFGFSRQIIHLMCIICLRAMPKQHTIWFKTPQELVQKQSGNFKSFSTK